VRVVVGVTVVTVSTVGRRKVNRVVVAGTLLSEVRPNLV